MVSRISVLGVPGYAAAKDTPASNAPRATASLPLRIFFITCILAPVRT